MPQLTQPHLTSPKGRNLAGNCLESVNLAGRNLAGNLAGRCLENVNLAGRKRC